MFDTHHNQAAAPVPLWSLLIAMLDEVDFGMLLLVDTSRVLHANYAARAELDAEHPLQLLGDQLRVRHAKDVVMLRRALDDAAARGHRRLLAVGDADNATTMAIVPVGRPACGARGATLVMFGKRRMCQDLSLHWFASAHQLTPAEAEVLRGLCDGEPPRAIAQRQHVAISTVRSQISAIRSKTRSSNIRALVRQVALLPPLVSALRSSIAGACPPKT